MAEPEFRQTKGGPAKAEGNSYDVNILLRGLKQGLTLDQAALKLPVRVSFEWLDKNKVLLEKWAREGKPKDTDGVSGKAKRPTSHIVKDGKVFAIYADNTMVEVKDNTSREQKK